MSHRVTWIIALKTTARQMSHLNLFNLEIGLYSLKFYITELYCPQVMDKTLTPSPWSPQMDYP